MVSRFSSMLVVLLLWGLLASAVASPARSGITASRDGTTIYNASGEVVTTSGASAGQQIVQQTNAQAGPAALVMSQNFEGSWPASGWTITDLSTNDGGEFLWGKRTCTPRTGTHSGWTVGGGAKGGTLACGANYPNNARVRALFGPFSLVGATNASLTYYIRGRTEVAALCNLDYLGVASGTSQSGPFTGNPPECGDLTGGTAGKGYYQRTLDLSDNLGQPQVWVAFFFVSDFSVTNIGITIDDIALNVENASTPTSTATATATRTPTKSPTATTTLGGESVYLPVLSKPKPTPTATATATPTLSPTPTSQPGSAKTFYLCFDNQRNPKEFLSLQPCSLNNIQLFVYAGTSLDSRSFELPLSNDIAGRSYTFEVLLASAGTTNFVVSAIVRQNGVETTLASTNFTAQSTTFQTFTATVPGIDPSTGNGDVLIVRIRSVSGSDAAILITQSHQTFLRIE